jgi:hypothetical protein
MNEEYLWELWGKSKHPHPKYGGKDMIWPMEFAELIVKECIKSAQPIGEYPIDGTWIEKSYWEGCSDAVEQIKEHFGVE